MPKSRKRGGQKAHNKRIKARNQRIASEKKKMQQAYTDFFSKKMEEFTNKYSGYTENNNDNDIETAEIVS